jgi:hypothetical protein
MKLSIINPKAHIAHINIHGHLHFRKSFIMDNNIKDILFLWDEEDSSKTFLYIKAVNRGHPHSKKIKHRNGSYLIDAISIAKTILKNASEAFLYFHKKTIDNGEPLFIFRIERKEKV